jgi:serine/threonine protein kinase
MKFTGNKLKISDQKRQFYYNVEGEATRLFLKVVGSDDPDLPIFYETTHDLYTKEDRHILFPTAIFFWPTQVALLFPRTSVDLHTYNKFNTMSESDVAFTMMCLLDALTYIHSKKIIHCDIKLENTVVCFTTRTAKVIDFEYATSNDPISKFLTDKPYGTIIAPEMKNKKWNNSIDFYCAGYLMFELCTDRGAHHRSSSTHHMNAELRRVRQSLLKSKFSHIYTSLIQKDPYKRIAFVETEGFVSAPIIDAIAACESIQAGETTKYNKYSDELIDTISKYTEKTHSETVSLNLLR